MLFSLEQFLQKIQLNLKNTFNYYHKFKKKRSLGQILNIYWRILAGLCPLFSPASSFPTYLNHTHLRSKLTLVPVFYFPKATGISHTTSRRRALRRGLVASSAALWLTTSTNSVQGAAVLSNTLQPDCTEDSKTYT